MARAAIIDYGLCNLDSIRRAIELCEVSAVVISNPDSLKAADYLILPGVGSFGVAMENLKAEGMDQAIHERVRAGTPLLGICLGMHLLGTSSEEGGHFQGLDIIPGEVVLLKERLDDERVPHIGWNTVAAREGEDGFLDAIPPETDFYFVHSYHFKCTQEDHVVAYTPYCGGFASIVRRELVVGTQFHPEKSQRAGQRLLESFLKQ